MKDLIINRIMILISRDHSGVVGQQDFTSTRWRIIAKQMYLFTGGNPDLHKFQKSLSTFRIFPEDLTQLSDEQLIELYELVVRRFSTQR